METEEGLVRETVRDDRWLGRRERMVTTIGGAEEQHAAMVSDF